MGYQGAFPGMDVLGTLLSDASVIFPREDFRYVMDGSLVV